MNQHPHRNPFLVSLTAGHRTSALARWTGGLLLSIALGACATEDLATTQSELTGASCVLGDGYVIPSGGHLIVYPVNCPSDCYDFPNGGLDFGLFCLNGVLGEWDPALTGGSVGPVLSPLQWNGYSRCTTRPNPYTNPPWGQGADRKTCVRL